MIPWRFWTVVVTVTLLIGLPGGGPSVGPTEAQVTLRYWEMLPPKADDPRSQAQMDNIASFEAKTPGVKVKWEHVPFGLTEPQLIQAAAAGDTPDVVRIYSMFLELHAKAGTIEPLDARVQGWDRSALLVPWNATVFDGKKIAIPHDVRATVLEYRDDLLKPAGVAVPRTWAELCKAAGTLTKGNVVGLEMGLSPKDLGSNLAEVFVPLVWAAGGDVLDAQGKAAFNSEAGVRALQAIYDIMHQCKGMTQASLGYGYNEVHEGLRAGTIAIGTLGSHRVATIRKQGNYGDRFRSVALPGFTPDRPAPAYINFWTLAIGRHSKQKDLAWKFIEHMTGREAELRRAKAGEVPTRKDTFQDPWFKLAEAGDMLAWRDYLERHGRSLNHPEKWQQFMRLLATTVQRIMLKETPIKPALDDLARQFNAL
jgi:multiple sugar transport system substrate-binding protein